MITIPVVTERCAGIDVGKRGLAVARLTSPAGEEGLIETRWFRTTVPELESLKNWINGGGNHYSSDGKHGLILDSGEERAGERPACRAGLLKEASPEERRKDGFSEMQSTWPINTGTGCGREAISGTARGGTAGSDEAAQEAAGTPDQRKEPHSENARG